MNAIAEHWIRGCRREFLDPHSQLEQNLRRVLRVRETLRDGSSALPAASEEFIRLSSPVGIMTRNAHGDQAVRGEIITDGLTCRSSGAVRRACTR